MASSSSSPAVKFTNGDSKVVLDNGTVKVTISKPQGIVTVISYGGQDNLLETRNSETNRGYWDMNWSEPDGSDNFDVPSGTQFKLVVSDGDKVEVSFTRPYDSKRDPPMVPLTIDKRFVMLRGSSGFYTYAIYDRPSGWADFNLNQTRVCFKLTRDRFTYMALADTKLRLMPSPEDLSDDRSEQLAYKEARLLTNPKEASLKGEVDDKYMYSCDNRLNKVHGWMCTDPVIGFWMITPSNEFRNGGPTKQDLTSHVGPTCLGMFHSAHYAGIDLCPQFRDGEAWRKVFGPVFIYLNKKPSGTKVRALWDDAEQRMLDEVKAWPYSWPSSSDYPKAKDRGQVSGRILVLDRTGDAKRMSGKDAFIGLAKSGEEGSWQSESKGYQFWTRADEKGNFTISDVRAGTYELFGWVPEVLGDYKRDGRIRVDKGSETDLGELVYEPPRTGSTLWAIGVADRTGTGYIPDPNPKYVNKLFDDQERYRQYGLWARYTELYPNEDLVYTIGESNSSKDWFFAHVPRRVEADDGSYSYKATTWQIKFRLSSFDKDSGPYTLRIAVAAANQAAIQVKVNDTSSKALFDTQQFGRDNAIARHGIHGLYRLFNIEIDAENFKKGQNTIFLNQRKVTGPYNGVMYDYLRLEAPSST